ncbi:hypothetical protein [Noviherbaspirillum malthae]|uniref:hypothetical protein n=1 Tax=Noviherbaspirillum malthae TaxID=1260987 RepID=UPI001E47B7E4|nr:hypothetical protein [Noviherbaspirillum malthae]
MHPSFKQKLGEKQKAQGQERPQDRSETFDTKPHDTALNVARSETLPNQSCKQPAYAQTADHGNDLPEQVRIVQIRP